MSEDFDELKEILDQVHDYGHYLAAICPFHEDSRPSLIIHEDTYKCLTCNTWGKTSELAKRLKRTVVKYRNDDERSFSNPFSRWLKTQSLNDVCKSAWQFLNTNRREAEYVYNRGVAERYRKALGIGYLDGWYTIPIFSKAFRLVGAVARANPLAVVGKHKYTQPHGQSSLMLYAPNWRLYEHARYVILTYGIFDAITLAINGVMAFSSVSGKTLNPVALGDIRKRICIWPDEGEDKEARILASKLGLRGEVVRFRWPDGCKDVNDVWIKYPDLLKEKLHELG